MKTRKIIGIKQILGNYWSIKKGPISAIAVVLFSIFVSSCGLSAPQTFESAVETGVQQNLLEMESESGQPNELNGGEVTGISSSTPSPSISLSPSPSATIEVACAIESVEISIGTLNIPASIGEVTEEDGIFYIDESEYKAYRHVAADCSESVWLNNPEEDWPLFIQKADGGWTLGSSEWSGKISIVNHTESPLEIVFFPIDPSGNSIDIRQSLFMIAKESSSFGSLPPGPYAVIFGEFETGRRCDLDVSNTSNFLFSVSAEGIAVFEESYPPGSSIDVDIETSPLCMGDSQ